MKTKIFATVVIMLLATGCATTVARRQFDDITPPAGMAYQPQDSVVIESPTIKAAQLVYRGRLEPVTLGDAMRTRLEASGWRHISRTSTSKAGTRQVYEKDSNALEVHIYEGLWYTYLAISASETLLSSATQTGSDTSQTTIATAPSQGRPSGPSTGVLDVDAPTTPESRSTGDRATRSADPSFSDRVKHFFTNLFSW